MLNLYPVNNQIATQCRLKSAQKQSIGKFLPVVQDTVSFSGKAKVPVNLCYEDFISKFSKLGCNEKTFIMHSLANEKKLGVGSESEVHATPLENYVIKTSLFGSSIYDDTFKKVHDDFPEKNFGQAVAKIGDVEVLKEINGKSLIQLGKENMEKYFATLAELPQTAYENFVSNIKVLNEKGYRFDPNPGNVILNEREKSLNIIDPLNYHPKAYMGDCLYPFFYIACNRSTTKEVLENQRKILTKLVPVINRHNVPISMSDECLHFVLGFLPDESSKLIRLFI